MLEQRPVGLEPLRELLRPVRRAETAPGDEVGARCNPRTLGRPAGRRAAGSTVRSIGWSPAIQQLPADRDAPRLLRAEAMDGSALRSSSRPEPRRPARSYPVGGAGLRRPVGGPRLPAGGIGPRTHRSHVLRVWLRRCSKRERRTCRKAVTAQPGVLGAVRRADDAAARHELRCCFGYVLQAAGRRPAAGSPSSSRSSR